MAFLESVPEARGALDYALLKTTRTVQRNRSVGGQLQSKSIEDSLSIFKWGTSKKVLTKSTWLGDGETALRIYEDLSVSEDSRNVSGMELVQSSQTGVSVFQKGTEELTVITANKLPLERVFGVDLIYINQVAKAVVLVQYKMLEDENGNWRFRPNEQLRDEMKRMDALSNAWGEVGDSFRISPEMHYFKFLKRQSANKSQAGFTIPRSHFDRICPDQRKAISFSYDNGGNYLRHETFCGLVRSGYIGSGCDATDRISNCIDEILKHGNAVVVAIHQKIQDAI